ncbi:MAG: HEAT repeat domain-containing protein [Polyangiaceae bacterium]
MAAPLIGHYEKVRALAAGARLLALGGLGPGDASTVSFFDHLAGQTKLEVALPCQVNGLAMRGEAVAAVGSDGTLRVLEAGKIAREVVAHERAVSAVAWVGDAIVTAGADGWLRAWTSGLEKRGEWHLSGSPLRAVALDATGALAAAAGDDGVVRTVHLVTGAIREMSGHEGPVLALAFTVTDGRLVSGGEDGTLRLHFLDGPIESEVRGKDESGHAGGVTALAIAPAALEPLPDEAVAQAAPKKRSVAPVSRGDRIWSAGADGKVRLWWTGERRKPRTLELSREPLHALAVSSARDAKTLGSFFVGGDDRFVTSVALPRAAAPGAAVKRGQGLVALEEAFSATSPAKRKSAIDAAAALPLPEAAKLVMRQLSSDTDPEVRALAATALAGSPHPDAKKRLRAALEDRAPTVRFAALGALRNLDVAQPLRPLRAALSSPQPDVRIAALAALRPMIADAPLVLGWIEAAVADADASVRRVAMEELALHHASAPVEALRVAFERGLADVRANAIVRAITARLVPDPVVAASVGRALDDEDAVVRRLAFTASVLASPDLARWMRAHDPSFTRSLKEVAQRSLEIEAGEPRPDARGAIAPHKEPPPDVITSRAEALVPPGDTPESLDETARGPLLAAFACKTADTTLRGAHGLALLGDPRALGALLPLSREAAPAVRRAAASALASVDDLRATRRIEWMLGDREAAVRDAAMELAEKLAKDPFDLARAALRAPAEEVRVRGLDVLVKLGKGAAEAEALLGDALEDEASKVRAEAFRTLWAWHSDDPWVPLDRALVGRFPDLRLRAIAELESLAGSGPTKDGALERLTRAIGDRDAAVGKAGFDALVRIRGREDARAVLAALAAPAAPVRVHGAHAAIHVAQAARADLRSPLLKALEDEDAAVRAAMVDAIDAVFPTDAGPLHIALQSSHLDLRVRAAELLAARRDERIIDPMQALILDKELHLRIGPAPALALRRRAATALASLGSPRLLRWFATVLLLDDDGVIKEQAARGLSNASRRGEEGYLLDALGHAELAVRSWAAEGLARLGDARAMPVLSGTLRHEHPPIRIGAILSFAALGPEGYGGLLQGLEDPSQGVQEIVLAILLARDLRAFRRGEPPELLTAALSSERAEARFVAARALELRIEPEEYLRYLVDALLPHRPEKAADLAKWPDEERRSRLMVALAEALAGDRPEQRYAAAQALRLRATPLVYFREVERATRPRSVNAPWVPETSPYAPEPPAPSPDDPPQKSTEGWLRRLFASGPEGSTTRGDTTTSPVSPADQSALRMLAFGAYVGLLRQAPVGEDDAQRVRRDAIERIVELGLARHVSVAAAAPALSRALDDPHHLVRKAAFAALRRLYADDADVALDLALGSTSPDVGRAALDELLSRGERARPRVVRALDANVPEVRKYAFEILEKLSPKGSTEPLLAALGSQHADVRVGVLEKLAGLRDPRVTAALLRALSSDHEDLRLRAAELLADAKDGRAIDVLTPALRSEDERVAERAREALSRLATDAAVAAVGERLEEEGASDAERERLIAALLRTRNLVALGPLSSRFADESAAIRKAAVSAGLELLGDRESLEVPFRARRAAALESGPLSPPGPAGSASPLGPAGPGARGLRKKRDAGATEAFLASAARAKDPELRLVAARELDDVPASPTADGWLVALFGDRAREVRVRAVESYATRVERRSATPAPLEDVVKLGARETLLGAAVGLSHRGALREGRAAFRPLMLYVRAGEDAERVTAIRALGRLGDPRALAELETIAQGGTEDAPADVAMQAAALEALGHLHRALQDPEARARVRERVEGSLGVKDAALAAAAVRGVAALAGKDPEPGDARDRSRGRLEAVLLTASGHVSERLEAAAALGKLGDPTAEAALSQVVSDPQEAVAWAALEALDKLFPLEKTRVEFHAVTSRHADIAKPAAIFLAESGDAGLLLERLPKLDQDLRDQIRRGLARRDAVPAGVIVNLLDGGSASSRADAAWLVGARSAGAPPPAADAELLVDALARSFERSATKIANDGGASEETRALEARAAHDALWALRRLAPEDARVARASTTLLESDWAQPFGRLRVEAALGLSTTTDLTGALSSTDLAVRVAAIESLRAAGVEAPRSAPADPVLRARTAHRPPHAREVLEAPSTHAWRVLAGGAPAIAPALVDDLIAATATGEDAARADAIALLGALASTSTDGPVVARARQALHAISGDKGAAKVELRKAAYRALRHAGRAASRAARERAFEQRSKESP